MTTGTLRIIGSKRSGQLQYYNGTNWGDVCRNGFDDEAGDVACRQLGYLRSSHVYTEYIELCFDLSVQIFKGVDDRNPGFSRFYFQDHLLSTLVLHMHCDCFENLIFVDDKLPAKTAKIISLAGKLVCIW